jgi:hypothetical protein
LWAIFLLVVISLQQFGEAINVSVGSHNHLVGGVAFEVGTDSGDGSSMQLDTDDGRRSVRRFSGRHHADPAGSQ